MVSSGQPVKAVNHLIFTIFTAVQSCSAPLCRAASFGAVLRAGRAETSATEQPAVHRPERCWALRFVNSCRLPQQWWEGEEAAGFGEGFWVGFGSSEEFASLQANVPGKPFPRQMELLFYLV